MAGGTTHVLSETRKLEHLVRCLYLNQGALICPVTTGTVVLQQQHKLQK
jgi:hypothetical protein